MKSTFRIQTILILTLIACTFPIPASSSTGLSETSDYFTPSQWDMETTIGGAQVFINKDEGVFEGYNLFMLKKTLKETGVRTYILCIVDMDGNIVLEEELAEGILLADCPAEFISPDVILTRTNAGAILYNITDDSITELNFQGHHEFEYNPNDGTFFTFQYNPVEIEGTSYLFDNICEFDRFGHLVWMMDTSTFITPDQWCDYSDYYLHLPDVVHSNTVFYDADDDIIYYNARNVNTFYCINHSTSEILWSIGEYGEFTLYDHYGRERESLWYHSHALEKVDDDCFILYDNDYHNETGEGNRKSRIIELTIDEDSMTANITWVWQSTTDYWCFIWGDADRLPNGNRVGVFGTESHPETTLGARLVEITDDGDVSWEMAFNSEGAYSYGVYRVERFHYSPIVEVQEEAFALPGKNATVSWDVFYNYRPKQTLYGTYEVYLDGIQVDSGSVTYDRYWRPETITHDFGSLDSGVYNATLVVTNSQGQQTVDSVDLHVSTFYLIRDGPTEIYLGDEDSVIKWSGATVYPYQCTLSVDGVEVNSFEWNGTDIELDLNTLSVGEHSVELTLLNSTAPIYQEAVQVTISYPPLTFDQILIILGISAGGVAAVVIVVYLFRKRE